MYEILKVLNNNTLLTQNNSHKAIFLGKGIGFGKKIGTMIQEDNSWEKYVLFKDEQVNINPEFLEIASQIIKETKKRFESVDANIVIPLVDHLQFAIKRLQEGQEIRNPFSIDIQLLYPEEYEIATIGAKLIENKMHITLPEDEIGFITLHVHSSISQKKTSQTLEMIECIRQNIEKLRQDLHISIQEDSIAYRRLMNHLKFLLLRLHTHELLQVDINEFTQTKFPFAYDISIKLCKDLSYVLKQDIPDNEVGYLALHIERILSLEIKSE